MALTTKNDAGETVPLLNLPNVLTLIRLALVPALIVAFWQVTPARQWWAFAIFVLAAGTDKLDGYFARSRGLVTDFGKLTDAIADKALVLVALVMLSWHGLLWWWITILFAIRELGITWMRMALKGRKVMAAGWWGKVKMVLQSVGIAILLVPWMSIFPGPEAMSGPSMAASIAFWVGWITLLVALFFAILSAWGYVKEGIQIARGK